ncbi:MAG: polysaccharide biosynthesis tyrosine autokinase [Bacteroidota bacterium]
MENLTNIPGNKPSGDIIQIDIQRWLWKLLSYWWLFGICLGIAIPAGQMYLRYTTFEYSARTTLMIKDAGKSGGLSEKSLLLKEKLGGSAKSMDNVIQLLKSLTLMEKVIEELKCNVSYFRKGNIKESELYINSPIFVDSFEFANDYPFGFNFYIELKDYKSFVLKLNEEDTEGVKYSFGIPFENTRGRFTISHNDNEAIIPGSYRIAINPVDVIANRYRSKLMVERVGHQLMSSVLELKMLDPVPRKASDVLNTLIKVYNDEEVKDKNKVLRNTIQFIDDRVSSLVNELDSVEGGIQQFKSANDIISESAASSMDFTLGEIRTALQQVSDFEIQKNILASLEKFLTDDGPSYELIPANLIAENPELSSLVNQYNTLSLQRERLAKTASEQNPALILIEEQMDDFQSSILQTIRNLQVSLDIPIARIEQNIEELRSSMKQVPGMEKRLLEQKRTQTIKENLFLFLLQKREETALSEATTTPNTRVIDHARTPKFAIYPRPKLIRMTSVVLGLLIPLVLVSILIFFENRVESEDTIKQLTDIPILGRISLSKKKKSIVVKSGDRSAINEMFRLLRTNLNFVNHNADKQVVLVTSSVSTEGKSFIAINLGITLSLSNKKVVILGLDLRKPKMSKYIGAQEGMPGITNYLIGEKNLDDIVHQYEGEEEKEFKKNENLFYISSGPTPPNPAELLMSEQMGKLIEELSERFDYIVMDTPPIGLVSDALLLRKYTSSILVVVRQKFTRRGMIKNLQDLYQKGELQNAAIVFNGVRSGRAYYGYGGYGYGYGYGYGNQGYYTDEKA